MSTPSYDVLLRLRVHGCFASASSRDINLERRLTLPFPPFDGLRILVKAGAADAAKDDLVEILLKGDELDNGRSNEPLAVYWNTTTQEFVVYLSDKTIYWAELHNGEHEPVETIAQRYIDDGWKRDWKRCRAQGDRRSRG